MAQVGNNQNEIGDRYLIQDSDHMPETPTTGKTSANRVRQAEQSQSSTRQQGGGDQNSRGQQGGEGRRQAH